MKKAIKQSYTSNNLYGNQFSLSVQCTAKTKTKPIDLMVMKTQSNLIMFSFGLSFDRWHQWLMTCLQTKQVQMKLVWISLSLTEWAIECTAQLNTGHERVTSYKIHQIVIEELEIELWNVWESTCFPPHISKNGTFFTFTVTFINMV